VYPVLFTIFGFPISTFGIMVGLAFLAGGWLSARSFEKLGHPGGVAWDLLTWCVVGGFLGAKLWWFAEELARNPNAGLATLLSVEGLRGGLTWYGGFFGGALGGILAARSYGLPVLDTLNAGAPALAASHAIGRIGCFLVGDDYGKPSDVPWAIAFPNGTPPTTERVHPTMLYETFWLIPVFAWLWHRRGRSPFLFGEWLVLSGIGRLWIEHLRINPPALGPFSNAQLVALACIGAGVASWLWFYSRPAPLSSRAAK
jgi:phosphatidylglycerol---prolipoprotein diacylglyceryl transferase